MITFSYPTYPDILTTDDVCTILNISKAQCLTLLKSGKLKGFKINDSRVWRVCKPAISEYITKARTA